MNFLSLFLFIDVCMYVVCCSYSQGAQSVLFAKCTALLLRSTIAGDGMMFVYWGTYFVLLGLGVTIFLQIRWLNSGLRMFSALMIVPIFQSFWILVSVISGIVFFGEYSDIFGSPVNGVFFPLGLLITIAGVYYLTRHAPMHEEPTSTVGRNRSRSTIGRAATSRDLLSARGERGSISRQNIGGPSTSSSHNIDILPPGARTSPVTPLLKTGGVQGIGTGNTDYGVPSPREENGVIHQHHQQHDPEMYDYEDEEENEDYSQADKRASNIGNAALHALAPLNFPLYLLPSALVNEPLSPSGSFMLSPNEHLSLDYQNIFKVREHDDEDLSDCLLYF